MDLSNLAEIDANLARLRSEVDEGERLLQHATPGTAVHKAVSRELDKDRAQLQMLERHRETLTRPAVDRKSMDALRQEREEAKRRATETRAKAQVGLQRIIAEVEGRGLKTVDALDEAGWQEVAAAAGVADWQTLVPHVRAHMRAQARPKKQ